MLTHSFVLDALDTTAADTFSHFEMLIDEHRASMEVGSHNRVVSRLKELVPSVGDFHTRLPLREAFEAYNDKYALTKRCYICISFNEIRHILNLAQILAIRDMNKDDDTSDDIYEEAGNLRLTDVEEDNSNSNADITAAHSGEFVMDDSVSEETPFRFNGPRMITFDGDQTLYSDGANFESNPRLANYLYLLLRCGVTVAVVTAAGYEYQSEKYELRLSGLLAYFKQMKLPAKDCERFFLFGGECNYLLSLGHDYKLHPVKEKGAGGWLTSTKFIPESPANWDDTDVNSLLDKAEESMNESLRELKIRGRVIRKKRGIGLIPKQDEAIQREALDESVLRVQSHLRKHNSASLPHCAFNGGRDVWVDVGNKSIGIHILCAYLGLPAIKTLHIGDQFLSTGNDVAARSVCPCIWITCPEETTYMLKSILKLASVPLGDAPSALALSVENKDAKAKEVDVTKMIQRRQAQAPRQLMDPYTGDMIEYNTSTSS